MAQWPKNPPANARDVGDTDLILQEDPLEKEMATHSVFLPGKFSGQRSLAGYSPLDCKESDMTVHKCTRSVCADYLSNI